MNLTGFHRIIDPFSENTKLTNTYLSTRRETQQCGQFFNNIQTDLLILFFTRRAHPITSYKSIDMSFQHLIWTGYYTINYQSQGETKQTDGPAGAGPVVIGQSWSICSTEHWSRMPMLLCVCWINSINYCYLSLSSGEKLPFQQTIKTSYVYIFLERLMVARFKELKQKYCDAVTVLFGSICVMYSPFFNHCVFLTSNKITTISNLDKVLLVE